MIDRATAIRSEAARAGAFGLFDLAGAAAAIAAAHGSGLLEAVLTGPGTPADYARRLGLDARATAAVLDLLVAFGFARREEDRYAPSAAALAMDELFPGGRPWVVDLWSHLPAFLAEGAPFVGYDGAASQRALAYRETVPALGRIFSAAAAELADRLPRAPRSILDVGAGSGVWSLAMAERNPDAHVTALDLPEVAEVFLERASARGLADRVTALRGDFHRIELPAEAFDRIILANVVHLEPSARARDLVARLATALSPGGELVIVEPVLGGSPERDRAVAVYALHLAMRTGEGRAHGLAEIIDWLAGAGLTPEQHVALDGPPGALVAAVGRRPA